MAEISTVTETLQPWPLVRHGDRGHPVETLEHLLVHRGHAVPVDGVFGSRTDDAVRAFQQEQGLVVDGIVGPLTWTALVVRVQRGSRGDAVRGVQVEFVFRDQSGLPGHALQVDGVFGPRTEAAVRGFQQALATDHPEVVVDGIVGPVTWRALVSGMLAG